MAKKLSTGWIVLIVVASVIILALLWGISAYNSLVAADETVGEKWANVQSAYQRRADLVPNLVETVKGYASHEKEVFTAVTEARAAIMAAKTPAQLEAADNQLTSTLKSLFAVAENYPQLKANENFLSLQDELAGTENRIKTERDIFNNAVKNYNIKTRRFPTSIIAGWFGFTQKESFAAEPGAEKAPKISFD